jgi:hypothetical protein
MVDRLDGMPSVSRSPIRPNPNVGQ